MDSIALIQDLEAKTSTVITSVKKYEGLSDETLNYRTSETSWSILECIDHLHRYGAFYLPEIEQRMVASRHPSSPHHRPGWLGDYFAKSMLPSDQMKKIKTFSSMNPLHSQLDRSVLASFLDQQDTMMRLLELARSKDLTKTKTAISISKWVKLRLGDTLRVVIYHNMRHIAQADRVLETYRQAETKKR